MASATEWFSSNELCLNVNKTQSLIITTKEKDNSPSLKFLGIYFHQDLKWNDHINSLTKKLSSELYAIRRMRRISTYQAALTTYHVCFLSRATYGIIVWEPLQRHIGFFYNKRRQSELLRCQAIVRGVGKYSRNVNCSQFHQYYIYHALLHVHDSSEGVHPSRHTIHDYPTRGLKGKSQGIH